HDAGVVSPVPAAAGRFRDELQPQPHGSRGRLAREVADERNGFAAVSQESFVDRAPPHAARRRGVRWIEDSTPRLPAHEGQGRTPERKVSWGASGRPVVGACDEPESRSGVVADGSDLLLGGGKGGAIAQPAVFPWARFVTWSMYSSRCSGFTVM